MVHSKDHKLHLGLLTSSLRMGRWGIHGIQIGSVNSPSIEWASYLVTKWQILFGRERTWKGKGSPWLGGRFLINCYACHVLFYGPCGSFSFTLSPSSSVGVGNLSNYSSPIYYCLPEREPAARLRWAFKWWEVANGRRSFDRIFIVIGYPKKSINRQQLIKERSTRSDAIA